MIETVNTLSSQSSALRASSQNAVSSYVESSASTKVAPSELTGSRIRVDNILDLAILEVRSGQGEVIRQYPTESQIRAFQRTAEIEARQAEASYREARAQGQVDVPAPSTTPEPTQSAPVDIPDIQSYIPTAPAASVSTSAPAVVSAPTISAPSGGQSVSVDA